MSKESTLSVLDKDSGPVVMATHGSGMTEFIVGPPTMGRELKLEHSRTKKTITEVGTEVETFFDPFEDNSSLCGAHRVRLSHSGDSLFVPTGCDHSVRSSGRRVMFGYFCFDRADGTNVQ